MNVEWNCIQQIFRHILQNIFAETFQFEISCSRKMNVKSLILLTCLLCILKFEADGLSTTKPTRNGTRSTSKPRSSTTKRRISSTLKPKSTTKVGQMLITTTTTQLASSSSSMPTSNLAALQTSTTQKPSASTPKRWIYAIVTTTVATSPQISSTSSGSTTVSNLPSTVAPTTSEKMTCP